jgi:hypothetical protein
MIISIYFLPIFQTTSVCVEDILETTFCISWQGIVRENGIFPELGEDLHFKVENQLSEGLDKSIIVSIWLRDCSSRKSTISQDIHEKRINFLCVGSWDFEKRNYLNWMHSEVVFEKKEQMKRVCKMTEDIQTQWKQSEILSQWRFRSLIKGITSSDTLK